MPIAKCLDWRALGRGRRLVLLLLLAFGVRMIADFATDAHRHPAPYDAHVVAASVAEGQGFEFPYGYFCEPTPTSYKSPLYVYFLAGLMKLGRGPGVCLFALAVQAALGALVCLLLWRLGSRFVGRTEGELAALLFAVYPPAVLIATRLHEINFTLPLIVWCLDEWLMLRSHATPGMVVRAGLATGLCLLAEPAYGLFIGLAGLWLLLAGRGRWRERLRATAVIALIAAAILTPWTIRNAFVHHRFVFVKSVVGLNLWLGNNPQATGSDRVMIRGENGQGQSTYLMETLPPEVKEQLRRAPTEMEKDRLLAGLAWDYMKAHPRRTLELAWEKIRLLWWRDSVHPMAANPWYGLLQPLLTCGGLLGLGLRWRPRSSAILLGLLFAAQTAVYTMFFVLPRYRLLQDPFLLLGVAALLAPILLRRWSEGFEKREGVMPEVGRAGIPARHRGQAPIIPG